MQICRKDNIKLKGQILFLAHEDQFSREIIPRKGVQLDTPYQKKKKNLQPFLGIMNYPSKYSLVTMVVWDSLRRLTSIKME